MPTTPQQWLEFARSLVGGTEAANRSASGRAYYAAYHACLAAMRTIAPTSLFAQKSMHAVLIRELQDFKYIGDIQVQKKWRHLGVLLHQLRTDRIEADYNVNGPFTSAQAQDTVDTANQLLNRLSALTSR